jgi:hypothetical protein
LKSILLGLKIVSFLVSGTGKISANPGDYILGGKDAAPGEIKWQVSTQIENTYNRAVTSILTL